MVNFVLCISSSALQQGSSGSRGLSRHNRATKAEMIDKYRNAPPHEVCK